MGKKVFVLVAGLAIGGTGALLLRTGLRIADHEAASLLRRYTK